MRVHQVRRSSIFALLILTRTLNSLQLSNSNGPAWSSENLKQVAESIVSPVVFAHVRAATEGTTVEQTRWEFQ